MLSKQELLDRLQMLIHNPMALDREIEQVFLELMAEDLLQVGNEHFHRRGRGSLLFDVRGVLGWRRGDMPMLYYLTYPDLVEAGHTSDTTEVEINEYDPDREVPVLFVYDTHMSGHIIAKNWSNRLAIN
jgi:hypothetical protein